MTEMPLISVVIPTYNRAYCIADAVRTAAAQDYKNLEIVAVDDGSTDDTLRALSELQATEPRLRILQHQTNKGVSAARNTGIAAAQGEFIALLDSDDTWLPEHLSTQMRQFTEEPSLDLVYSDGILLLDSDQRKFMDKNPSNGEATFEALIVERCQIPISTVVARKQALMKAGLFDETLPRCDDYDMWVRTAFAGAKIGYNRTIGAKFFVGRPGSLSHSKARMIEGYWNILEKFKRTLPLKDADRAVVEARAAQIRARYLLEEGKCKLEERQFDQARELISEANDYLRKPSLSAAVFGLKFAPGATAKVLSYWTRLRNEASA